jgi:hypothetical protein
MFCEPGLDYNARPGHTGGFMRADSVEVSWDSAKSNWLVRIVVGEEVVRRHCSAPQNADDAALRAAALKALQDEGYDADASIVKIKR